MRPARSSSSTSEHGPGTDPSRPPPEPRAALSPGRQPGRRFPGLQRPHHPERPRLRQHRRLSNLAGRNGWNGDVILGSPPPVPGSVSIGYAQPTWLLIEGVVSDPNRQPTLNKVLPGRVILNNANTYRGGTIVQAGVLNIRDSQALGPPDGITVYPPSPASNVGVRAGRPASARGRPGPRRHALPDPRPQPRLRLRPRRWSGRRDRGHRYERDFHRHLQGQTTASIPVGASAAQVEAALVPLSTISAGGGSVTVTKEGTYFGSTSTACSRRTISH